MTTDNSYTLPQRFPARAELGINAKLIEEMGRGAYVTNRLPLFSNPHSPNSSPQTKIVGSTVDMVGSGATRAAGVVKTTQAGTE